MENIKKDILKNIDAFLAKLLAVWPKMPNLDGDLQEAGANLHERNNLLTT